MQQRTDEQQDYMTPPELLEPARRMGGGRIALDPCATRGRHDQVRARVRLFKRGRPDYFSADWVKLARGGLVFVNPEYSDMDTWGAKLTEEARRGAEVVALLPARTDAAWWHAMGRTYAAKVELRGRVRFLDPRTGKPATALDSKTGRRRPSSGKFPSAVIYFGHRPQLFLQAYGHLGEPHLPERVRREAQALGIGARVDEELVREELVKLEAEGNRYAAARRKLEAKAMAEWQPTAGNARLLTGQGRLLAGVRTMTGGAIEEGHQVVMDLEAPPARSRELVQHLLGRHTYQLDLNGGGWSFTACATSATEGMDDGHRDRVVATLVVVGKPKLLGPPGPPRGPIAVTSGTRDPLGWGDDGLPELGPEERLLESMRTGIREAASRPRPLGLAFPCPGGGQLRLSAKDLRWVKARKVDPLAVETLIMGLLRQEAAARALWPMHPDAVARLDRLRARTRRRVRGGRRRKGARRG